MKKFLLMVMVVLGLASVSTAGPLLISYTDWIDVEPDEPTTTDWIDITVGGTSGTALVMNDTSWELNDNNVNIYLDITSTVMTVVQDWSESFAIGTLPAGDYQVIVFETVDGYPGALPMSTDFTVTPEPASLGLLVCGALAVMRRW